MSWLFGGTAVGCRCVRVATLASEAFASACFVSVAMVLGPPAKRMRTKCAGVAKPARSSAPKLPTPQKTGNFEQDTQQDAQQELFDQIVDDLTNDPRHILPTFTFLQKRKKAISDEDEDGSFLKSAKVVAISTFGRLDDELRLDWLARNSDMTAPELLRVMKKDPQALGVLMQFAMQVGAKTKLPAQCKYSEVLHRFLNQRYKDCGERLRTFKAKGG